MILSQDLWPGCAPFFDAIAGALLELHGSAAKTIAIAIDQHETRLSDEAVRQLRMVSLRLYSSFHELSTDQRTTPFPDYSKASSQLLNPDAWSALEALFETIGGVVLEFDRPLHLTQPQGDRRAWPFSGQCLSRHLGIQFDSLSDQRQRDSFCRLADALQVSIRKLASVRVDTRWR